MKGSLQSLAMATIVAHLIVVAGCEKKQAPAVPPQPNATDTKTDDHGDHDHEHAEGEAHDHDHDHAEGEAHDHDHDHTEAGDAHDDHGPTVELGSSAVGTFQVKASRDGDVVEGGEAPVDLWITPAAGTKVGVVRAWIGTQDGKGSMKAKLDLEKDNYHSHVEVPKPMPAGSKLWIEIEDDKNVKATGSFDLKK